MKKIIFIITLSFVSTLLFSQQNQGPIYVNYIIIGPYVCEFAVNGARKDMIEDLEPYIQNGRVYFYCLAFPISSGNLRPGFEFNLDLEDEFISNPRIKAVYRGSQNDACNTGQSITVAGYAERGTIVITNVFFNDAEIENWEKTVRLAF